MDIQIDASALVQLSDAWKRAPEMVIEELTAATYEAEMLLERETKEFLQQNEHKGATGELHRSIHSLTPEVLSNTVIGVVGSNASYAAAVELGTKPHPVSAAGVASIEDWVRRKLGIPAEEAERVANAVAWKIRVKGTPAKLMFTKTLAAQRTQIGTIFQAAAGRIGQRLAGAV